MPDVTVNADLQVEEAGDSRQLSVDDFKTPATGAATEATVGQRYAGGKTAVVATVTDTGDTDIHQPSAGNAIRLFWVSAINDPDQETTPLIRVLLGDTECYRTYAVAHWEVFDGAADEPLTINLSAAGSVAVTAHIEEFTP